MTQEFSITPAHELMQGMSVQHLRFVVRATDPIAFDAQPGSALRGALYNALASHFCSKSVAHVTAGHTENCPVCWLMALEDVTSQRGRDVPRPLTIQPPVKTHYRRDELMVFGGSLVGRARDLLPYLARAVEWMGHEGVGRGRGRFRLIAINEYTPLLDAERLLMDGNEPHTPTLAVTPSRIAEQAETLRTDRVNLYFLTPMRLIADSKLVKTPDPAILVARLLERCQNLAEHYAETDDKPTIEHWKRNAAALVDQARSIKLAYSDVEWVEIFSGSKRQGRATPISGFIGATRWEGDLGDLREWLLWGESLHVGKNAVKGNGWYRIERTAHA